MKRFILRYRGAGAAHPNDIGKIRALPDTTVVDDSSPRMLLVEAPEHTLRAAVSEMPNWIMSPEQSIELPDPRPKIVKSADDQSD